MNIQKTSSAPTIQLKHATLARDSRVLWESVDMSVQPGEFVAILGPNGTGKTSLLKVLLGLLPLSKGRVSVLGEPPHRGNAYIGYIPQQKGFDADIPIRGGDLVRLGLTGVRYGLARTSPEYDSRIDEAIERVGASSFADMPLGLLSGGEQQRLRIAQALVSKPKLLLCDEPLLSLDVTSQQVVTKLIDEYRRKENASVIFVTHEVNPILQYIDSILYLTAGHWAFDKPDVIMQAETLSKLYGSSIEVIRIKDRVVVVGTDDAGHAHSSQHGAVN